MNDDSSVRARAVTLMKLEGCCTSRKLANHLEMKVDDVVGDVIAPLLQARVVRFTTGYGQPYVFFWVPSDRVYEELDRRYEQMGLKRNKAYPHPSTLKAIARDLYPEYHPKAAPRVRTTDPYNHEKQDKKVLFLLKRGPMTIEEIRDSFKVKPGRDKVRRILHRLEEGGKVERYERVTHRRGRPGLGWTLKEE